MVRKDEATNLMLDDNSNAAKLMEEIKVKLNTLVHINQDVLKSF